MEKRSLSERDICTKLITPALRSAGWDEIIQIREEVSFTKGRIIVRGKLVSRGKGKRADYILSVNLRKALRCGTPRTDPCQFARNSDGLRLGKVGGHRPPFEQKGMQ